jgi:hypothetical protein
MKQKVINCILSKLTFTGKRQIEFFSGDSFITIVFVLMAFYSSVKSVNSFL